MARFSSTHGRALTRRRSSSGRKDKLGSISKQGDLYLCSLFMAGAFALKIR
jgi:transposase